MSLYPCDGCGTTESSQLHQLVHTEAVLTEELLVYFLGLLLPVEQLQFSLDTQTVCILFYRISGWDIKPYPRYLMVWAMVDAGLLLKQSFLWVLVAADSGHVPGWARTAAARDVTRKPIPNRARTLNIQVDPPVPVLEQKTAESKVNWRKSVPTLIQQLQELKTPLKQLQCLCPFSHELILCCSVWCWCSCVFASSIHMDPNTLNTKLQLFLQI